MISVITPTYNREDLVQRTINSIISQTYSDWELIVVDDGSTDNTEQEIQKFLADPRISYFKKANTGQPHSLNVGVGMAKGEFVVFLDSDDEAYPNWLSTVAAHINENTGIVCCEAIRKFLDGSSIREGMDVKFMGQRLNLKFTCGSLFIRRSLFDAIGGYDTELKANIQTDLGYRLLTELRKTKYQSITINEPLLQINIHAGPRIRTDWSKRVAGGIRFLEKHYEMYRQYDKHELSSMAGSIAYSCYKLKKRKEALTYMLKAIRYNPFRWRNYLRVIRYGCL